MNELKTKFGTKAIKCSFLGENKFMIAISTNKDLFEVGNINTTLTNPEILDKFFREIEAIYDLADYFRSDEENET